jgi:hypothetical protein
MSLQLDEGTAAAEVMAYFFDVRSRDQKKNNINKFFTRVKPNFIGFTNTFYTTPC